MVRLLGVCLCVNMNARVRVYIHTDIRIRLVELVFIHLWRSCMLTHIHTYIQDILVHMLHVCGHSVTCAVCNR